MTRLGQTLAILIASIALLAGSPGDVETRRPDEISIPDSEIGLAKGSVFDVADPDPVVDNESDPGDGPPLPRPFVGAPPRVPHSLAGLLPITRTDNLCIDCHLIAEAEPGDPTPIPESHLIDLRNAATVVGESVAGARYICTSCHVPTTEAKPLPVVPGTPPAV